VSALAARDAHSAAVLVWNYHDDDLPGAAAEVDLTIDGLPNGTATLMHARVDADHSNAYTLWKEMGSPQTPTPAQYRQLETRGQLETMGTPESIQIAGGRVQTSFRLPRQGVSLVRLTW
jgi:xylan 1,4-beta-xylosidase